VGKGRIELLSALGPAADMTNHHDVVTRIDEVIRVGSASSVCTRARQHIRTAAHRIHAALYSRAAGSIAWGDGELREMSVLSAC
jgi:hypothetical protein